MFGWLKSLLGMDARISAASERAAAAMERIAATLKAADVQLQRSLGLVPAGEVIDAPATPAIEDASEGKRRRGKVA